MRNIALVAGTAAIGISTWFWWRGRQSVPVASQPQPGTTAPDSLVTAAEDLLNINWDQYLFPISTAVTAASSQYPIQGENVMQPRGITNNNPLNIRENNMVDYDWRGEADSDWDPQFEEFTTPFYGIRAAARILRNYRTNYGLNTVRGIISRWAPPEENPTDEYINFVAKNAGVTDTQALGAVDYIKVVAAMIRFENGFNPYETSLIASAVNAGME